jgi:hypothetical protein
MISADEKIEIIRTKGNGYIVVDTYLEEIDEGNKIYSQDIDLIEDTGDDKDALKRLLESVAEKCGFSYDKYGKENLNITFDKKGHKVE